MPSFFSPSTIVRLSFCITYIAIVIFAYLWTIPYNFPQEALFTVNAGESLTSVARKLKDQNMVHSTMLFKLVVFAIGGERSIIAGQYLINEPSSLTLLAHRLTSGDQQLAATAITIPEGATVVQIAEILTKEFPQFNTNDFLQKAKNLEGYLFPETYHFYPDVSATTVIATLQKTFAEKIQPFEMQIQRSGHSQQEIITMASILEREAQKKEDWQIISGILWKRIAEGMPLQVDATFYYERGLPSLALTTTDLRTDSAYNTYTNKGLPPTPIANPGSTTIEAALQPIATPYWYYLSDKTGKMHYARTHDEHVRNKNMYLR